MSEWLDSKEFPKGLSVWRAKRVCVTGGNGFLGKNIVRKLQERGADVFVADQDRYDLRRLEDTHSGRALSDSKPQTHGTCVPATIVPEAKRSGRASVVIHLAARVGGIGANSEHPAEFFGACPDGSAGSPHGLPKGQPDDTCTDRTLALAVTQVPGGAV